MVSATALCHGAATVVNAIATGRGAAFGIEIGAKVTVELKEGIDSVVALKVEDPKLVEACVLNVLKLFPNYKYGAVIQVESEIPEARGLKSSSVVANAAVLATFGALAKKHGKIKTLRINKETSRQQLEIGGKIVSDETILNVSVESAKQAGVTITGALDDAGAAYFGGFVVSDNLKNRIARRGEMERLSAVILVPEEKAYTKDTNVEAIKAFSRELDAIWNLALTGDVYTAMTLNGLVCSTALGQPGGIGCEIAAMAMKNGAIAAGLSGKGPAMVAITKGQTAEIAKAWGRFGKCLETKVNNEKAKIVA